MMSLNFFFILDKELVPKYVFLKAQKEPWKEFISGYTFILKAVLSNNFTIHLKFY